MMHVEIVIADVRTEIAVVTASILISGLRLDFIVFTDRISEGGNAIASVHLSFRLFPLSLEPTDV